MQLYLIRHAETVDNIAGLYAGVRDSQLTNYGVDQIARLGEHLATTKIKFTHIFASPLTRAHQTASAIRKSQLKHTQDEALVPEIVKVAQLIEQDFGYYEGKTFQARSSPGKAGRESHVDLHRNDPGFQDVETKESMGRRADEFLDEHLMPLTQHGQAAHEPVIAIVSHGMLLSTLWRRMLQRMSRGTVSIAPEVTAARGPIVLEHLGGWSNTGYLHLALTPQSKTTDSGQISKEIKAAEAVKTESGTSVTTTASHPERRSSFRGFDVCIVAVDSKTHLIGLKRQRGGIGRLAHDNNQKKLDSFFKKPKIG